MSRSKSFVPTAPGTLSQGTPPKQSSLLASLIRDSVGGNCIRFLTSNRMLQFEEEKHPELWYQFVDPQSSRWMALYGQPRRPSHSSHTNIDNHADHGGSSDSLREMQESSAHDQDLELPMATNVPSRTFTREGIVHQGMTGERVDPEKGLDSLIITWWNENDGENPQNWSTAKKVFVTFELCMLTFGIYIGSSIYAPGEGDVMRRFGVSNIVATLGVSMFVAGYGLGPFLWSPLSEVPYVGRNWPYILTLAIFVALQVPTLLATNLGMLLAFRFLTGFFGSPVLANGGASIGDMFGPTKRAYAMGIWGVSAVCGPSLGPLVGGFAAQANGWKWPIWELMWLSGFALAFLFFLLPETSGGTILTRRARRLRHVSGNPGLRSEAELEVSDMTARSLAMAVLVRPFVLSFAEPMVFLLNMYLALIYGLLYVWFESFAIVFIEIYHFNIGQEGLTYIGLLVGAVLIIPPFYWWMHVYLEPRFDENGNISPEARLPPACVAGFMIPICLFWFGWTARPSVHWIVPIIGSAWFSFGAFMLFISIFNYLCDAYPVYAASVLAGNDLFRSSFGAGFPVFATPMYRNLGVGWASSTLGFISVAFIPIPFALYRYGRLLRMKYSMYARKDI